MGQSTVLPLEGEIKIAELMFWPVQKWSFGGHGSICSWK